MLRSNTGRETPFHYTELKPLSNVGLQRIAQTLIQAEDTRRPIAPLTETEPGFDLVAAYEVQSLVWQHRLTSHRPVGHKVGLTSLAMQRQLGVNQPDFGRLHDGMAVHGELNLGELIQARIEPEIAFVLGSTLQGPGVTVDAVLDATSAVASRRASSTVFVSSLIFPRWVRRSPAARRSSNSRSATPASSGKPWPPART